MISFTDWSERFFKVFIPDNIESDSEFYGQARLFLLSMALALLFAILILIMYLLIDFKVAIVANSLLVLAIIVSILIYRATGSVSISAHISALAAYCGFMVEIFFSGGIYSAAIPWLIIVPIGYFFYVSNKMGYVGVIAILAGVSFFFFIDLFGFSLPISYPSENSVFFHATMFLGFTAFIVYAILVFFNERLRFMRDLIATKNDLVSALSDVKELGGLLPICSSCKKIRDDKGYWQKLEMYISDHSKAEFTHGICPDCLAKLYPDIKLKKSDKIVS